MTKKQKDKLKRLIREYKDACTEDSWSGGGYPEDMVYWEKQLKITKRKLYTFIKEVETGQIICPKCKHDLVFCPDCNDYI